MTLPAEFLAIRSEMLEVARRRVFFKSTEPIPEMPAWPGIYTPPPVPVKLRSSHVSLAIQIQRVKARAERERNPKPQQPPTRAKGKGDIPPGTIVTFGHNKGTVLAFLPPYADPKGAMPPGTPWTREGGHHEHFPAPIGRYCVAVMDRKGPVYFFPKAASIEKCNPRTELLAEAS